MPKRFIFNKALTFSYHGYKIIYKGEGPAGTIAVELYDPDGCFRAHIIASKERIRNHIRNYAGLLKTTLKKTRKRFYGKARFNGLEGEY